MQLLSIIAYFNEYLVIIVVKYNLVDIASSQMYAFKKLTKVTTN